MRSFTFTSLLAATLACSLLSVGCRKSNDNDAAEDIGYATDYARFQRLSDNAEDLADNAAQPTNSLLKTTSQCATVTHDTISIPHVVTVDFGNTNCLCKDGKYRRGQIIMQYTGHYADSGYQREISFNQYFVNDNQLLGTKSVTNMGRNAAGQTYFSVSVNGSMILANGNGTRTWISARKRTWTAGEATTIRADDEYDITGSGTLTRANGKTFNMAITTPLHRSRSCDWIQNGVIEITASGGAVRTLDFGTGSCDSTATLSWNGRTRTIQLP